MADVEVPKRDFSGDFLIVSGAYPPRLNGKLYGREKMFRTTVSKAFETDLELDEKRCQLNRSMQH